MISSYEAKFSKNFMYFLFFDEVRFFDTSLPVGKHFAHPQIKYAIQKTIDFYYMLPVYAVKPKILSSGIFYDNIVYLSNFFHTENYLSVNINC